MMAFLRGANLPTFRNNRVLQQYVLTDVTPTGKILGTGSYGSVLEVTLYGKLNCAAKKIHDDLLLSDNQGTEILVQKYEQECQIMASLRHPNITQFLGIYLPDTQLPLLVMEQLDLSLDDLLEYVPNLPLTLKMSFLEDICGGLHYLHTRNPPIVHRDLTAKNVLLTSSLSAKITDMGNSRIVSLRPGQLARTLSRLPGTLVYMPQEALSDEHRYGPSLDIFSFGHLALFTLTQVFPGNLLPYTYRDPNNGHVQGRTEIERRSTYIQSLEASTSFYSQPLVDLVKLCLNDAPEVRPSSEELLDSINTIKVEVERSYGGSSLKVMDISKVQVAKKMKQQDELQKQIKEEILHEKEKTQHKDEEIQDLNLTLVEIHVKNEEMNHMVLNLQQSLSESERREDEQKLQIRRLEEKLQQCQKQLPRPKENLEMKVPQQINWTRGPNMPLGMNNYIQSLTIHETVYVGGADTGYGSQKNCIVMAFNLHSYQWQLLPPCTAQYFAMVIIQNQLVLVGGMDNISTRSNLLSMWDASHWKWTTPYTCMPTPRYDPSAVGYKEWLIVAGGWSDGRRLSTVEVLDTTNNQWHSAPPTPTPWSTMKSSITEDTWYLMGGCTTSKDDDLVYSVSLPDLISCALSSTSSSSHHHIWKEISGLGHCYSTPLCVGRHLLALGGERVGDRVENRESVSTIHHYDSEIEEWVEMGQLPFTTYDCACTCTLDQQILVFGGNTEPSMFYIGNF